MVAESIAAIIMAAISVGEGMYGISQAENRKWSNKVLNRLVTPVASKIANMMSKDNELYTQFMNANTEERSNLINQLSSGLGYGKRYDTLREQYRKAIKSKDSAITKHVAAQQRYTSDANAMNTAYNALSSGSLSSETISGLEDKANEIGSKYGVTTGAAADALRDDLGNYTQVGQNVKGGMVTAPTPNYK